jgi:porin
MDGVAMPYSRQHHDCPAIPILTMVMLTPFLLLAAAVSDDLPRRPHSHIHAAGEIDEAQGPVLLEVTYTGEVMGNVSGGVKRRARYLDNLDIVLEADLEAMLGWRGAEAHVYGIYNNGASISNAVGDAHAVSNIETGTRALKLYEAWIDQMVAPGLSLRAGLYDLNSEFDSLDAAGVFVGSAHGIGSDIALTGRNGPSLFPSTSLAARVEWRPAKGWAVRAALLDGVPGDPDHPARTAIKLGKGDGALLIGELEAPLGGARLLLGHWRYTATFDAWDGSQGQGNGGVYLRGEMPLMTDGDRRIDGFFRLGTSSARFNMFDRFASMGVKWTGALDSRPEDELGVAVITARTSADYRRTSGMGRSESVAEVTYRAPLSPWLTVQPNMQYVRNPAADPTIRDAWVVGLRFAVGFRLID